MINSLKVHSVVPRTVRQSRITLSTLLLREASSSLHASRNSCLSARDALNDIQWLHAAAAQSSHPEELRSSTSRALRFESQYFRGFVDHIHTAATVT